MRLLFCTWLVLTEDFLCRRLSSGTIRKSIVIYFCHLRGRELECRSNLKTRVSRDNSCFRRRQIKTNENIEGTLLLLVGRFLYSYDGRRTRA